MPFKPVDPVEELKELNALLDSDPILKKKFEADQKEFEFRLNLARARKEKNLTQNTIKEETGLTQQAISRIEKGSKDRSPTLNTLLRYLDALGFELTIQPKHKVF
jgi:DNA-binding XRE family transcriptional regulator